MTEAADPRAADDRRTESEHPRLESRVAARAIALLPGALIVYFGFNGGGFFPGSVGFAALILIQLILLRVLLAEEPLATVTWRLGAVVLLLGVFAGWELLSATWSHSNGRSVIDFDRDLLYIGACVLFGLLPRRPWTTQWLTRGLLLGLFVICGSGLVTRLLPHVWPTSPDVANNRLSFPVTYWNALGLLAAVGILVALAIAASDREPRIGRALALGSVPILAATLFFTFSRGAIAAFAIGLVAFVIVARPRNVVVTFLAAVPATAITLVVAYNANELATINPTTPTAVQQGHHVAIVVLVCVLGAALAQFLLASPDRAVRTLFERPRVRRLSRRATLAALAVALVVAIAAGGPGWVSHQYHRFTVNSTLTAGNAGDLRQRLTDPSNNQRTEHWSVALKAYSHHKLDGTGADTYQFTWARYRNSAFSVVDAHSLYLQLMSELGLPGFALLVAALVLMLVALAQRARGPNRVLWAGLFAAVLVWAAHTGIDWDWQMPVTTVWVFAVAGLALSGRAARPVDGSSNRARIPIAVALLACAITPALVMLSQARLQAAATAFDRDDCRTAQSSAISSIGFLATRPQPYQIMGYCDLSQGRPSSAVDAMRKAVANDPGAWEYHYSLGVAEAAAGIDPRPEFDAAARMNPLEAFVQRTAAEYRKLPPSRWQASADAARSAALTSGQLTFR